MGASKGGVCVIIPAYNQRSRLAGCVSGVRRALSGAGIPHEIIIAEDGSTDGSCGEAGRLEGDGVRVLHSGTRLGKGRAISRAILASGADVVAFVDADLPVPPSSLASLAGEVEAGADIAIGSRLLPASRVRNGNILRGFLSRSYNIFIRALFGTGISDHQCGLKAFRRGRVLRLLRETGDGGWFWDTELLVRAKAAGLSVREVSVEWEDSHESCVNPAADAIAMGLSALRLRLRMWGLCG